MSIPLQSDVDKCLLYEPPQSAFIELVMQTVVGTPIQGRCNGGQGGCSKYAPYVEKDRLYGNDWPPFGYTMIGKKRLENFRCAIQEVDRNNIPGKKESCVYKHTYHHATYRVWHNLEIFSMQSLPALTSFHSCYLSSFIKFVG